ncbi:hypothetical protein [Sphingobacterium psychroaquaticum]|uniref:Uncharacterized protein n=1 Tax=Sphingobacterium psychroaquaticum TaxID=561061 RepID=A0A1X7K525_9SPHI|nr:hypothetical protein [Sphingobacterium psychroaquaticum]SMG35700.1 hypothetical protein SAMN05660862_2540 [Sphingobacterium psychroaquaticum]
MRNFSDFNIKVDNFTGKKIEIDEVVGNMIEVLDYKLEPSKFKDKGNGMRLTLSIRFEEKERVIFTGSVILQEQCEKVRDIDGFPFAATITALKPRGYKFI